MTIKANDWCGVKVAHLYCQVQRLLSSTNPKISVPKEDENTRGVELVWFARSDETSKTWTKRVMIMKLKKALRLLREPNKEDLIAKIKFVASRIPVSSASRDGEFTVSG